MNETSPLLIHDFTDDEIEVANILANLKTLRPLYEPPNLVPLTPCWLSKGPRSDLVSSKKLRPDRLKRDSAAVPGRGNRRNASPNSPLLLKSSSESFCVQGRLGPIRGKKEAMGGRDSKSEVPESDFPVQIDGTLALCFQPRGQLPVSQLALANGDRDPDLTDEASSQSSARISLTSLRAYSQPQFLFDLNLLPEFTDAQSTSLTSPRAYSRPQFLFDLNLLSESTDAKLTPPDEKDRKLGQTPYDHAAAYDGSLQSETAKAARKRRLEIYRMKNGKCVTSKAHPSSRHL